MREEFAVYGFPPPAMYAVGAIKVGLATALLAGLQAPKLVRLAAIGLAAFMLGAIGMHVKVKDPVKRATPAMMVFTLSTVAAVLADGSRSAR